MTDGQWSTATHRWGSSHIHTAVKLDTYVNEELAHLEISTLSKDVWRERGGYF